MNGCAPRSARPLGASPVSAPAPGVLDLAVRAGLRIAYGLLRAAWALARPRTIGVHALVWLDDRVLLVQRSYVRGVSLPAGSPRRGEPAAVTAMRELAEETGLGIDSSRFRVVADFVTQVEAKHDRIVVMETSLDRAPSLRADGREVTWVGFVSRDEALTLDLWPPVRSVLESQPMPGTRNRTELRPSGRPPT